VFKFTHRRKSKGSGEGAAASTDSGKAIIFWTKATFFGQKPAQNFTKYVLYLLNEKTEFIASSV